MPQLILIACSIFESSINHIFQKHEIKLPVIYIDSMLHMYPEKLKKILDKEIETNIESKIILVFGDCHARMIDYEKNKNVKRIPGVNCCEIYMGKEKYKEERKAGSFILLPEWIERWEQVFKKELGFKTPKQAKPFMKEMHSKLLYINTETNNSNESILKQVSEFVGLPVEVYRGDIGNLENLLLDLIKIQSKQNLE